MRVISVSNYPIRSYPSIELALDEASNWHGQSKAKADSQKLIDSCISDAYWTETDFIIGFSNARWLHIWVSPEQVEWMGDVQWEVHNAPPVLDENQPMRIGSEPIHFQWSNGKEDICDISALVLARRGAKFQRLQVNEGGLLIYCYERMILWVGAICRTDIGRPIIFVFEGD